MRYVFVLLLLLLLPFAANAASISRSLTSSSCVSGNTTGCVTLSSTSASVSVQLAGTWTASVVFEGSNDNASFTMLRGWPTGGGESTTTATTPGTWLVDSGGLLYVRVRAASYTSGDVAVSMSSASARPVLEQVGLRASTLAALGTESCVVGIARRFALGTTSATVPLGGGDPLRSALTVINTDSLRNVSCLVDPGDGTLPDCATPGFGITLLANGGSVRFPTSERILCAACTAGGAIVEYVEESCR